MSRCILLDTGPLIAFLDRRERFHIWAREAFAGVTPPLRTCEAVLAEACFISQRTVGRSDHVLELVTRGVVTVGFDLRDQASAVENLLVRYTDQKISLADACLIRMSELIPGAVVLTLDSDFRIYRRMGRQTIPALMPA